MVVVNSDRLRIRKCQCRDENYNSPSSSEFGLAHDSNEVVSGDSAGNGDNTTGCTSNVAYITDVRNLGWRLAFQRDNGYEGGLQETRQECWASAYTDSAKEIMKRAIM